MWSGVFPGQGSQFNGMGSLLYNEFPLAKQRYEEASDTLSINMKTLCHESDEATLSLTENTQPALLLNSVCFYEIIQQETLFQFKVLAGHSVGEYAAFVCSGSLKFSDALLAVRQRGKFMQSAVPVGQGGMTALMGIEDQQVHELCQWTERNSGYSPVEPANFNCPGQVVITGNLKALSWLQQHYDPQVFPHFPRIKMIPLKVSAPFHGTLMKPAEEKMSFLLKSLSFSDSKIPIIQNTTAQAESRGNYLKEELIKQISRPVRWTETMQQLNRMEVQNYVEFGPGKVLTGLMKKTFPHISLWNLNSLDEIKSLINTLNSNQ